eukprot:COSAG02_NODE_632_length_19286_cov_1518.762235_1_plen_69_part_00
MACTSTVLLVCRSSTVLASKPVVGLRTNGRFFKTCFSRLHVLKFSYASNAQIPYQSISKQHSCARGAL